MSDFEKFIRLVRQMRQWQRSYFRTRSQEALENAKDLEFRVDAFISKETAEPTLFD